MRAGQPGVSNEPPPLSRRQFLALAGLTGTGLASLGMTGCGLRHHIRAQSPPPDATAAPDDAEPYFPPARGDTWEQVNPATLNWDPQRLAELLDYAGQRNSTGLVILHRGRIALEQYWQGWDLHRAGIIASCQKSITAFLAGVARDEALLSLDDPVSKLLGKGWSRRGGGTSEERVLIRHLLTMTSGLDDTGTYEAEPGSRWYYNTPIYYKAKEAIQAAARQSFTEFSKSRLWDRIGMRDSSWVSVPNAGDQHVASTRDMARFGLLIQNGGLWARQPLINDPAFLRTALESSQTLNPAYGYLWWLNGKDSYLLPGRRALSQKGPLVPSAPSDMVAALGAADKKIYVVPSLDLVVARHGESAGETGAAALSTFDNVLWQKIMAVVKPGS